MHIFALPAWLQLLLSGYNSTRSPSVCSCFHPCSDLADSLACHHLLTHSCQWSSGLTPTIPLHVCSSMFLDSSILGSITWHAFLFWTLAWTFCLRLRMTRGTRGTRTRQWYERGGDGHVGGKGKCWSWMLNASEKAGLRGKVTCSSAHWEWTHSAGYNSDIYDCVKSVCSFPRLAWLLGKWKQDCSRADHVRTDIVVQWTQQRRSQFQCMVPGLEGLEGLEVFFISRSS